MGFSFEQLEVYKKAICFAGKIYKTCEKESFLDKNRHADLLLDCTEIAKMLNGLISSLLKHS